MKKEFFIVTAAMMVFNGCSLMHETLQVHSEDNLVDFNDVINDVPVGQHNYARWGGTIIGVDYKKKNTTLVVRQRSLRIDGSPDIRDSGINGTFLAEFDQDSVPFKSYPIGQNITFLGHVTVTDKSLVSNDNKGLPVLNVEKFYLWGNKSIFSSDLNRGIKGNRHKFIHPVCYKYTGCVTPESTHR